MFHIKKCLLLFLLLLVYTFVFSEKKRDVLKLQYDSCHNYIKQYGAESPVEALRHARKEIEIGESISDNVSTANGYIDASRALYLLSQYEMALDYAHKALTLSQKISDGDLSAEAKRLCGAIYTDLEDIYNARKYLNEAIGYYENKRDTACLIRALGTLAISMGRNEQYEECIWTLRKVYEMSSNLGLYSKMYSTLMNLANAYDLLGESDRSIQLLDSIKFIIPPQKVTARDSVSFHTLMGWLLFRKKEYTEAKKILENNVRKAKFYNMYEDAIASLGTLSKIARKEKKFELLSEYYEDILNMRDSTININTKEKVSEMEVIYELAQKNAAIDRLTFQNRWNKQRLILIIIILITAGTIVLIKIQSNAKLIASKAQLLNEELQNKRTELTNMAIYYYELRRMIGNLYKRLKQISNNCRDDEVQKAIIAMCTTVANSSTLDETKTKINNYIDTNYSEFISRLSAKFPDLTDPEKRICAMLLIDFTTKEISDVLNMSEKSINNIRSKIRKKMDVPENFSISGFLKTI